MRNRLTVQTHIGEGAIDSKKIVTTLPWGGGLFCKPLVSDLKDGSVFPLCASHRVALQLGRIYPHPVQKNRNLRTSTCCRIVLQRSHVTAGFGGGAQLYAAEPLLVHSAEPGRPRPLPVLPLLRYERGCSSLVAANRFACLNMTSTARVIVCRYHALASRASLCVCVKFSQ
jgi:hypothetical protein